MMPLAFSLPTGVYLTICLIVGVLAGLTGTLELASLIGVLVVLASLAFHFWVKPWVPSWEAVSNGVSDWLAAGAPVLEGFWIGFGLGGVLLLASAFLMWFVPWNEKRA